MEKTYSSKSVEDSIYKNWEKSGSFKLCSDSGNGKKDGYCIVMPPPNVTGVLHMGHSAMITIEDILIRFNRMLGSQTLWIPGTDHAAIATQTKVEKILKEDGLSRHNLGSKKFLERVERFASESHDTIVGQVRKMGASCDWSREAYTLDKTRTKAVRTVFKMMYDDGLIYRGDRVVNWCPRCHSTLADDEVEYKDQSTKIYTFKYSDDFPFTIATTRPETKLGDTAVAVNPKDKRYKKYIGKTFDVNFLGVRLKLRVIGDRGVDMDFGTGALGVTPAHSFADWQMAESNKLNVVKVIDENAKIRDGFGEFSGKDVFTARKMIVDKLKSDGLLEKEDDINNSLSACYRCDAPVEPLPSLQWFVDVNKKIPKYGKSIKEISVKAVRSGVFGNKKINIYPKRFEKSYFNWMDNLHDWCISRQILFGHQIPVWYKNKSNNKGLNGDVEIYVGVDTPSGDGWVQDTDTLDTWFSSGLWTFSAIANNPDEIKVVDGRLTIDNDDFKKFHPTDVLETAYDILFFWVARMIIMTTYAVGDIPFKDVYLHGLVLDENGKKMSKSKGNVVDPLDMIDRYGADATRLSLVIGTTPGNDSKLSDEKIIGCRNFINKLWNVARYVSQLDSGVGNTKISNNLTLADRWILGRMSNLIDGVGNDIKKYNFSQAGERLKEFTRNDFADWYLELSKFEKNDDKNIILIKVLKDLLKLWHPFIPFVTEEIWKNFDNNKMIISESWPDVEEYSEFAKKKTIDDFDKIKNIITAIRNARSENKIEPSKKIGAIIHCGQSVDLIKTQEVLIKSLRTGIDSITIKKDGEKPSSDNGRSVYIVEGGVEIYLVGAVDVDKERRRIQKEMVDITKYINTINKKLQNKDFVNNAPSAIVNREEVNLKASEDKLSELKDYLKNL